MRKIILILSLMFVLIISGHGNACVGKILYIGILDSPDEQISAEMLSLLINERTGTTVNIKYYKDSKDLYEAVKKKQVSILIENTDRAMEILGKPRPNDSKKAYDIAKEEFSKNLNLVWLNPFGFLTGAEGKGQRYYTPVITADVLNNFPALPRLINKLSGIISDETFAKLVKTVKSGEKPRKTARDFLKEKKLI